MNRRVPVIDLFAGPGGLSEGFSQAKRSDGEPIFRVGLSIEKEATAHRTLALRAAFRSLQETNRLSAYYQYVRGEIDLAGFLAKPNVAAAFELASKEAKCAELGKTSPRQVDEWITVARRKAGEWVLIGGPPCQAYSLAGRSRRANDASFAGDEKHFLYREYLRIIARHEPAVFVMENVKGLLSASHSGQSMFVRMMEDLSSPKRGLRYDVRSFIANDAGLGLSPNDYVIQAERFGVPQRRHRVILLGVLTGHMSGCNDLLETGRGVSLSNVIGSLPRIRSSVSGDLDSQDTWQSALAKTPSLLRGWAHPLRDKVIERIVAAIQGTPSSLGGKFLECADTSVYGSPALDRWLVDDRLEGVLQHQARAHMASDLQRYMFAAAFASVTERSPRLRDFPLRLLPKHRNASQADAPFEDRFRVQTEWGPSTTVVSHIAKDGHYYIHPDASQCRSLTVREAARLQTFPDNYFFEGNRTQQYTQVGNAVPPFLARQIANVVASVMRRATPLRANARDEGARPTAEKTRSNRRRVATTS